MTPWGIYSTAREFRAAFERCYENGLSETVIPSVVCLVFAIELGLKAIHATDGAVQTGHNLYQLFIDLPDKSRAEVLFESGVEEKSFLENLSVVSNAFLEWRYIHEKPGYRSISVEFLEMVWAGVNAVMQRRVEIARAARRAAKSTE